jgi:hypothetical protein
MDIAKILDAMEKTAVVIFEDNDEYVNDGKRGVLAAYTRNKKNKDQWDGSLRNFGVSFRDYGYEEELVINNGVNFDALVHGKIAFSRRTGKDSGTNYYQVLGNESWWKGAVISDDGRCICAFAGFSGEDDRAIALAGINAYEAQKAPSETKKAKTRKAETKKPEPQKEGEIKTGSLLKTASLTRAALDSDGEGQEASEGFIAPRGAPRGEPKVKPAKSARSAGAGSKAGKKSKKGK